MPVASMMNRGVPVKWVAAGFTFVVSTFVSIAGSFWYAGGLKADIDNHLQRTDAKIAEIERKNDAQDASAAGIPDRLTRIETILCTTHEPDRIAACAQVGRTR